MTELTRESVVNYLLQLEREERQEGTAVWMANNNLADSQIAGCDLDELYKHLDMLFSEHLIEYLNYPAKPIDKDDGNGIVTRGIVLSDALLNNQPTE